MAGEETRGTAEVAGSAAPGGFGAIARRLFEPLRAAERERAAGDGALDRSALVILLALPLCLTFLEYLGSTNRMPRGVRTAVLSWGAAWLAAPSVPEWLKPPPELLQERFVKLSWWSLCCFLGYFLVPAAILRLGLKKRLRDYGLSLRGLGRHLKVSLVLYLLVLPAVVWASGQTGFQRTYPFYEQARLSWRHLLAWELLYGLQFFSLEFFFRGFVTLGLRARLGAYSIFVMVVPYCMIHFGKPVAETLGAIVAGLVLGILALRTRSIWGGVAIHIGVALSMDLLVLLR